MSEQTRLFQFYRNFYGDTERRFTIHAGRDPIKEPLPGDQLIVELNGSELRIQVDHVGKKIKVRIFDPNPHVQPEIEWVTWSDWEKSKLVRTL